MEDIVKIDGAVVKGGGQVLRNSASYAAILGKSVQFVNVRTSRRRPGLLLQYLEGLEVVAKLSNSTLVNAREGSQEVSFHPQNGFQSSSPYEIHTKNAATSLLLQASLPVLLFLPHAADLVLTGGTNTLACSASIDYMRCVLVPLLRRHFDVNVEVDVVRRDCMPIGDALVKIRTHPTASLLAISLRDRGRVARVSGFLYGYGKTDPGFVPAAEMALRETLRENDIDIDVEFKDEMQISDDPLVCRALVYAETSTGCILGGGATLNFNPKTCILRGCATQISNSEELMSSAVRDLVKQLAHGGCTDEYLQDQLVIFMALADGVSEIVTGPITEHTTNAIRIAEHMTDARFSVTPIGGDRFEIRCEGIRHMSPPSRITSTFLTCSQVHQRQDFGDMF